MISDARLRDYVGADATQDSILSEIESGVVAYLSRATGDWFGAPSEQVEVVDPPTGGPVGLAGWPSSQPVRPSVWLSYLPTALDSVDHWSSDDWVAQDLADYELRGRELVILDGSFPTSRQSIRVTYTAGYAEDAAPADVEYLVLGLVKHMYDQRGAGAIQSASIGPMRITFRDAKDAGLDMQIALLRRPQL